MQKIKTLYKKYNQKWKPLKFFKNFYVISFLVFALRMFFFDNSTLFVHKNINAEIKEANNSIMFYKKEIQKLKKELQMLKNKNTLEKFARENYYFKNQNENIFIINEN